MKKSILSLVTLVAIFVLTSCNKYEAKTAKLVTLNDSLNYTLGLSNGDGIKNYYMKTDSTDKPITALIKALDEAYKEGADKDEMYKLGVQIGNSFKQQKAKGLMGDSTLKFDEKLVVQGLYNAMNGFKEGMTPQEAQDYIQRTMQKIQMSKMQQAAPTQAPAPEAAPATEETPETESK